MEEKRLTPIKAIRAKCLECSCGNNAEVRECVIPDCPLYPYRMGKNPYIKMSEELIYACRAYLRGAREKLDTMSNQ